ncbi:hypothetical protein HYPSUDRAFT_111329, partial [Hypholoma sublateritium FD-334 SS-4]
HADLGHKGIFTVRLRLLERFWWPSLDADVKWFIRTCHECQLRLTQRVSIPPTVPPPMPLFRKWYIDTFLMPASREIVTDNAPQYIAAVNILVKRYHIHHIRISPYNSKAQGPIERRHYDVRESILKATDGKPDEWPDVFESVFWSERVSIQKSTGMSPYHIAHGLEAVLPFDLAEGTYLAPVFSARISTEEMIATRAIMLQKRPQDLARVHEQVLKARWAAVRQFEKTHASSIVDFNFQPGSLVLVRNSRADKDLSKHRPRYLGPMFVVRRTTGGSYILAELDGSVSRLRYAASRLLPYAPRNLKAVPVTSITDLSPDELE